ncbi:MAG: hypothetical protein R6V67_05400 [Spirochaetia bacterium]
MSEPRGADRLNDPNEEITRLREENFCENKNGLTVTIDFTCQKDTMPNE